MPAKLDVKPEYRPVSVKVERELYDRIEEFWRLNLYQDRTDFVKTAMEYYIETKKCPRCGSRNPSNGQVCSVCCAPLTDDGADVISLLRFATTHPEMVKEFLEKKLQ